MNNIADNVKKVMVVFLLFFIGLISYITYVYFFQGEEILSQPENGRLWAQRNKIIRGTIYDRDMNTLVKSKGISEGKQELSYTKGAAFAHVLGYMDSKYGLTGLQNLYDQVLMGNSPRTLEGSTAMGEKKGFDLQTTLDSALQEKAYTLLGNNRGSVVALNPKTGEILAMVSKPSFDPNKLKENWKDISDNSNSPLLNRAVSGLYPPGSTFKTITAVSALENIEGIQSKQFEDTGKLVFNETESLSNYKGEKLGNIDLKEAFVHSSNVVFGSIGMDLGNKNLRKTAEDFYFNRDIPADGIIIDNSRFPELKKSSVGDIAQSAIGQSSVLATPIEMALVASAVANDGIMMRPMLVKEVLSTNGRVVKTVDSQQIGEIMSKENSQIIKDYMRDVVKRGTGETAAVNGIEVCGKTGTADHDDKPDVEEAPHSWFIGFAPYDNPEIAFAVIVEEGGTGGGKAASIARELVKTALFK